MLPYRRSGGQPAGHNFDGYSFGYKTGFASMNEARDQFTVYDEPSRTLKVTRIPAPAPGIPCGESSDTCYISDREEIFVCQTDKKKTRTETWIYSIANNKWRKLNPVNNAPPSKIGRIQYVPEQNMVLAVVKPYTGEQWVYSFEHNTWQLFEKKQNTHNGPKSQLVYSVQYGVFVWYGKGKTLLMRPEFDKLDWDK